MLIDNKLKFSTWKQEKVETNNKVYKYKNKELIEWIIIQDNIFTNNKLNFNIYLFCKNFDSKVPINGIKIIKNRK